MGLLTILRVRATSRCYDDAVAQNNGLRGFAENRYPNLEEPEFPAFLNTVTPARHKAFRGVFGYVHRSVVHLYDLYQ